MTIERTLISSINIGNRCRQDLGDIAALARSIRDLGLLQPVVITAEGKLVAGHRRLAALKELGRETADCYVVRSLDDAIKLLKAERDENECRKDFTPSEAVAIGERLKELERAEAQKRQEESRARKGQKVGTAQRGGNLPPPSASKGKTRDKVAQAVGMSGRTYEKAKAVVEAAEQAPEALGPVKEEMDRTGKVEPAYQEVRRQQTTSETAPQKKTPKPAQSNGQAPRRVSWRSDVSSLGHALRQMASQLDRLSVIRVSDRKPEDLVAIADLLDKHHVASRLRALAEEFAAATAHE